MNDNGENKIVTVNSVIPPNSNLAHYSAHFYLYDEVSMAFKISLLSFIKSNKPFTHIRCDETVLKKHNVTPIVKSSTSCLTKETIECLMIHWPYLWPFVIKSEQSIGQEWMYQMEHQLYSKGNLSFLTASMLNFASDPAPVAHEHNCSCC